MRGFAMRWVLAILTMAGLLWVSNPAVAQSDSHIRIDNWGGGTGPHDTNELAKQLSKRMGMQPSRVQPKSPIDGMDPKMLEQLRNMLLNDPQKYQEILKNNPQLAEEARKHIGDPNLRDQLQSLGKNDEPTHRALERQRL